MVVEILDDAALPNYLTIGRLGNIGITLFNGDGDSVGCYGPDPDSGQALQVQFQEPARHLHQIQIRAPEADDLFILVWLANIQNIQGDVDVGKARPILKGNKPIQLRVTWNERTFPVTLQSPEFSTLIPLQ